MATGDGRLRSRGVRQPPGRSRAKRNFQNSSFHKGHDHARSLKKSNSHDRITTRPTARSGSGCDSTARPIDGRFEDLTKGPWYLNVFRDFTAGLIVAMVAIPLAMGFAMASGLPPEMGIVGGAVAGLVGALFGGSKYQVYGPTAAFIPVIVGDHHEVRRLRLSHLVLDRRPASC